MTSVFVSYSRRDWPVAEGLVENLANLGLKVWIDSKIGPRSPFATAIDRALTSADVVIVVWTTNSIRSDWVRWEAGEALKSNRLLQLHGDDIKPNDVPAPFNQYNIYGDGDAEYVKALVEQMARPNSALPPVNFANPKPRQPREAMGETSNISASSGYVFSIAALVSGLVLQPVAGPVGSMLFAIGLTAGLALLLYSIYFSVSRFSDRFGRTRVMEALVVGTIAGAFSGVTGGLFYASRDALTAGQPIRLDLFTTKYVRVILIGAIVGMALSYLIVALLRYARLRERNLGPVWSRRTIIWNISVPVVLVVALTVGTAIMAASLPRIGQWIDLATMGKIDWIGAGKCASVRVCSLTPADPQCTACSVGNMFHIDVAILLGIYLWTIHVYHLRQAGGRVSRILVSSIILTCAVLAVVVLFQIYPDPIRDAEVMSWRVFAFSVPWLLLVTIALAVIYLNARSIERSEMLRGDPS